MGKVLHFLGLETMHDLVASRVHAWTAATFWDAPIDPILDIELSSEVEQCGAGTEFVDGGPYGRGNLLFGGDEVLLSNDFWFAVDAL